MLTRTEATRGLRYDESLTYTADVDIAIASAKGGALYHMPEPLIANRYHARNATRHRVTLVAAQMRKFAAKHSIALSPLDLARGFCNGYLVAAMKLAFLYYTSARR